MKIIKKSSILEILDFPFLIQEIEKGFILHSQKRTLIAPPSFLSFKNPPADVHIKSGTSLEEEYYLVKIASGFYDNPKVNLPSSNGLMLLFSKITGTLLSILLDEGMLTDLRTAIAGAISVKYLKGSSIQNIGIIGTGTQAKEQLYMLQFITECRKATVWGRNPSHVQAFLKDPKVSNFQINVADSVESLAKNCDVIITTTPSKEPLLFGHHLKEGTHVVAVGADGGGKQELDASVFKRADLISVDCMEQCLKYGDLSHAKAFIHKPIFELGTVISEKVNKDPLDISVTDLTGIAIQDLQIAKAVYTLLSAKKSLSSK